MEELKPCPFCGGEAREIHPPAKGHWMGFWRIRCTVCGAMVNGSHRGMNIEAWNRRADECDREALLSVCAEIEDADVDGCIDWADRIRKAIGEVPDDAPVA